MRKSVKEDLDSILDGEFNLDLLIIAPVIYAALNFQRNRIIESIRSPGHEDRELPEEIINTNINSRTFLDILTSRESKLADVLEQTTMDAVLEIINKGVEEGLPFEDIAKMIEDNRTIGINKTRATLIARTEVNQAFGQAQVEYMKALGAEYYMVSLAVNACDECREKYTDNGVAKRFLVADGWEQCHPNERCVPIIVAPSDWF